MKKAILALAFAVSTIFPQNAQVVGKAIGVRFGYGAEISYQHPLSEVSRVELDLGFDFYGGGLNCIYHRVWELSDVVSGLNWYAGIGAGVGMYSYYYGSPITIGLLGQIGIEYSFEEVPIQISLDYRPGVFLIPLTHGVYDGVCLAVRYEF